MTHKESVENDIEMLRIALDSAEPSHIQKAVDILKADLKGWDHHNIGETALYQRANHLLSSIHNHHLD